MILENKVEKLSLIDGSFDANEANEILTNIFSTKINFHKVKNFSSQVRFDKEDQNAIRRIAELKENLEKVSKIIAEARFQNQRIQITSEIKIKIIDEDFSS